MKRNIFAVVVLAVVVLAASVSCYALTPEEQTEIEREYDNSGNFAAVEKMASEDTIKEFDRDMAKTQAMLRSSQEDNVETVMTKLKQFLCTKRAEFKDVELDPQKEILIEEILSNFDMEYLVKTMATASINNLRKIIKGADVEDLLTEDVTFALNSNETNVLIGKVAAIIQSATRENVKRSFKNTYGEYYTVEELQTIADFYKTSAGRKATRIPLQLMERGIDVAISISPIENLPALAELEKAFNEYDQALAREKARNM